MQYILTDIEGTTTSVHFVYDTLFPYFLSQLEDFFIAEKNNPLLLENIALVQQTVAQENSQVISNKEVIGKLIEWTKADRKHGALKNVQGMVWKAGYENGELQSHIYEDVPPAFEHWKKRGLSIGIYSSGSVSAQQLLFRYSIAGDLTGNISNYFDTRVGNKREPGAYSSIQQQLQIPAGDILFLSDVAAELDAAAEAGFETIQIVRDGTAPTDRHKIAPDFNNI